MNQRKGKYRASMHAEDLRDCMALILPASEPGMVLAQFDYQWVNGEVYRPGDGKDQHLPYCFGLHLFPEAAFEFETTPGHGFDCNCLGCVPEPHSLDQLRRRF